MKISIVIPLYNKAPYIRRAIMSVLNQTFQHFELIVVDDGSTDDGGAIVSQFDDNRIIYIRQENRGVAAARNTGIKAARYELIAFLDADDAWEDTFLETAVGLVKACPEAFMYATSYRKDDNGHRKRPKLKGIPKKAWCGILPAYFHTVLGDLPVISSAVMIRRSAFDIVGLFKEGEALGEDQDMWCRIAQVFPVAYSTKPCAVYYINTEKSTCYNRNIVQTYPVISELKRAISQAKGTTRKYMALYLSKLYIDYAVRLIRAHRFREVFAAMRQAPTLLIIRRMIAYYYLLKEMALITIYSIMACCKRWVRSGRERRNK